MGQRGPVGKRADQRHGHRTEAENAVDTAPGFRAEPPPVDENWHQIARAWYESLASSGQAHFYEASDWATAVLIAESISRDLSPQVVGIAEKTGEVVKDTIPLKGASLSAYLKAMGNLLVTEGDRRRMRVELERPKDEEAADVSWLEEARRGREAG